MPSNKKGYMGSYYHKNKNKFNNPLEKEKRASRNAARRLMVKKVGKAAVKGKDVNHKTPLRSGGRNTIGNLNIQTKKVNRGNNGKKKKI